MSRACVRKVSTWVLCAICAAGCWRPESAPQPAVDAPTAPAPVPTSLPSATPTVVTSPAYPGTYTGTPTPNPAPTARLNGSGVESYVVQPGETLSLIAAVFGCTVDEVAAANGLDNANSISAGQTLYIPVEATESGPYLKLIPDSELVYGPAYIHFDLDGFVAQQGGYLASYTEQVEGSVRTGAGIVQLVSQRFSVGPRVLLALLELRAGWVTNPQPAVASLECPLTCVHGQAGLFGQLSWAAVELNQGYYGWKRGDHTTVRLGNGVRAALAPELNPGSAGVQRCLAGLSADWDEWTALVGADGFLATYEHLFGNPFAYTADPLVPPGLGQPEMLFPWEAGKTWYYTGGPHGGWGSGSGRAALDFVPSDKIPDCTVSKDWVVAALPGLVLRSEFGEVIVDTDGDGYEQSGWVLLYMHIHSNDRVEPGVTVQRGQPVGHPSCEGGFADATHLHFARRYNGEWIPAGSGPIPMVLSQWMAQEDVMPYEGTMMREGEIRTACECWTDEINGLTSDNSP